MRKVIIGDIHGCITEFKLLLEKVGFQKGIDQLFIVGDLINKGPDSKACFDFFMEMQGTAVLGNHEYHLIRDANGVDVQKKWIGKFKEAWGDAYEPFLKVIQTWPFFHREDDFLMVHAGLAPDLKPEETDPFILTNIRTWGGAEGSGFSGEEWAKKKDLLWKKSDPPWFDLYKEKEKVIFGHWAALEGVSRKNAIGLDTGCVYGKRLTALVLPEWELVSLEAKEAYCRIK
ncbi:MAG: metallophosphoesterase [SAR324 cluster bacterium]|nr:metallophosphoesterase [SAR324 cluster bacterium]